MSLDLVGCAAEPIRSPGSIQPHGWLIAFDRASSAIVAYSVNWTALTGHPSGSTQSGTLSQIVAALLPAIAQLVPGRAPAWIGTISFGGRDLDVTGHSTTSLALLEFELGSVGNDTPSMIRAMATDFVQTARGAGSIGVLVAMAAAEMKRITGFGRCLIYSFDAEDHGSVLAENADAGYDSYLGHSFAASDIPAQARALYLINHIRVIPDAQYTAVPLHCDERDEDARTIDLSFAQLRSISPVHIEYMRSMRTMASMSVSIIVRGRLWGLISCHNHAPRGLDFQTRVACEHLGELLSLLIEGHEAIADLALRYERRGLTMQIISRLGQSDSTLRNLIDESDLLLGLTGAQGAAIVSDEDCWLVGATPSRPEVLALANWVSDKRVDIYHTDHLAGIDAWATAGLADAAGLLAVSLSRSHRHLILWFRPERVRSVMWAGEPAKLPDEQGRLHPRKSFRSWEEIVRRHSAAWTASEIAGAAELRRALLDTVLQSVRSRAEVTSRLSRVSLAKEAAEQADSTKTRFLAILSHELRTPLASIAYAAKLLARVAVVPAVYANLLPMISRNVAVGARLVDDIFDMSAIEAGKLQLSFRSVDMDSVLAQVVEALANDVAGKRIQLDVSYGAESVRVRADPVRMQQVMWNILRNAIKFTPQDGLIEVHSRISDDKLELTFKDSGIGIDASVIDGIFLAFGQGDMETHHRFGGLGLGLAIAAGIVQGHTGTLAVKSDGVGLGATFILTLPVLTDAEVPRVDAAPTTIS